MGVGVGVGVDLYCTSRSSKSADGGAVAIHVATTVCVVYSPASREVVCVFMGRIVVVCTAAVGVFVGCQGSGLERL